MLRVHLAEVRDSWTAWLGVCITFITVNAALVVPAMIMNSGMAATARGELDMMASAGYTAIQGLLLGMICFVALPVMGAATGLVVDSRRGSLARLALAGATPGQVRGTVGVQLATVSLASALVGDAIGIALVRPAMTLLDESQRGDQLYQPIGVTWGILPVLAANLLCVVVALLGGRRHARRASEIPPVEALRQASAPVGSNRLTRFGWVKVVALVGLVVGSFGAVGPLVANPNKETVSNLLIIGFFQIFVWGALLSVAGPVLVGPVASAWTRLVPSGSPAWQLARATISGRSDRIQRSLAPVMFCVGIAVGTIGVSQSMLKTFVASGKIAQMGTSDLTNFVAIAGLPLLVAFAGGVGTLVMMSRQRDAELALIGISGATPAQRLLVPTLEAVIITVTAVILAMGMVLPAYAFQAYALTSAGLDWQPVLPFGVAAATIGACLLITVGATVLPTLRARVLPENRVIARLVAE